MKKIALTQGKFALVDDEDFDFLNQWGWAAKRDRHTYYAERSDYGNKPSTVKMHRLIMKAPPGTMVDHLNHDGLDNRKSNLKICSHSENGLNRRGPQVNSKSGVLGVYWHVGNKKWRAVHKVNGKRKFIGHFDSLEEAKQARERYVKAREAEKNL